MANTGIKAYANRRRLINGVPDGYTEPNAPGDNYIPPVEDLTFCPVITWQPINPTCQKLDNSCNPGYTLSADGTTCTRVENIPPTSQQTPINAAPSGNGAYTNFGTRIYDPGYDIVGNGTFSQIPVGIPYWSNTGNTSVDGPMNRNGIWVDNDGDGIRDPLVNGAQLQISFPYISPSAKTVYVGIGGDNQVILTVNNVTLVSKTTINSAHFKFWHVYPVQINAGYNLFTFTGIGDGSVQDCLAAEIYDATATQIMAAQSDADLDGTNFGVNRFIFRTRDLRGGVLTIATCAPGYNQVTDPNTGAVTCTRVLTEAPIPGTNSGIKIWQDRERLADSFIEPNIEGVGVGPYFPPITDTTACPL